jgi:peptidoglycan/LPS O-acetylase OafA/YrhL
VKILPSGSGSALWVAVTVIVLLVVFWRETRRGRDDERSSGIKHRAGYYAYLISIYLWLVLRYFERRLDPAQTFAIGMIGMALAFGLSWLILTVREMGSSENQD